MGIIERFFEVLDATGITPYEIEHKMGVKSAQSKISQMKKGETKGGKEKSLPSDILSAICAYREEVNSGYILTGKGNPLKLPIKDADNKKHKQEKPLNHSLGRTIKYYPTVNGSMGGIQFLDNPDESFVDIIIPGFSDCEFAINAYGDSMYPVIKSGQVVLLMPWREKFIEWGRIYLVVTKSGYRTIKYIKPSKNDGCVLCESENKEESPAFEIEKDDILKMFLVKGWICKDAI